MRRNVARIQQGEGFAFRQIVQRRFFAIFAFGLQPVEFCEGFGAFAIDPSFLDMQIPELLFVRQVGLQQNSAPALGFGAILENGFKLLVAMPVNGILELLYPPQTPVTVDDDLDEFAFQLGAISYSPRRTSSGR